MTQASNSYLVRTLNDDFRTTFVGGNVHLTASVNELPSETRTRVVSSVQSFNNFTEDNDPHGEHDFGSFETEGTSYCFKIDYYTLDMQQGAEDPSDQKTTARVLTIMRADEY